MRTQTNGLGDRIERALALAGITSERVDAWVGQPCGCRERRDRLNQLGWWTEMVIKNKLTQAAGFLMRMMSE